METPSNKLVDVVIVTSGSNGILPECLDSVLRQTGVSLRAFCMDNSADDSLQRRLLPRYPRVEWRRPGRNLFYTGSLNEGISLGRGEFVLCLNDDVVLEEGFLGSALRGFSQGPEVGMVSGKVLRLDGETLDSTGLFLSCLRTARERGYGEKDRGQFDSAGYCFGVTGAAAFYRRRMLEEIRISEKEYFDSDYRFFYEDLDTAWRAQRRGWKCYYVPEARARHLRGGSVRNAKGINRPYARRYLDERLHADLIKNRYLTIIKNDTVAALLKRILLIVPYEIATWAYVFCFRPRVLSVLALSRGCLKRAWSKRKAVAAG